MNRYNRQMRVVRLLVHSRAIPLLTLLAGAVLLLGVATPSGAAPRAQTSGDSALFGPNVYVFNPRMPLSHIRAIADRIAKRQIDNQFGSERYALLFEPGSYGSRRNPLNMQVGYYTAVAGLGAAPADVVINGVVQVRNRCIHGACIALDNFWRSLSNLTINVMAHGSGCDAGEIWAVSQAAPMRRMRITGGDLKLWDSCTKPSYASGGFIADSDFSGAVINGTQQQFMVRDSRLKRWQGGSWNQVFSGVVGAPSPCFPATPHCGPFTTLAASPVTREAPYLYMDSRRRYRVMVPAAQHDTVGPTWANHSTPGQSMALVEFYIATPKDTAGSINAALRSGKNLILTPGVYHTNEAIAVGRVDAVVLGLGFPTLIPELGITPMMITASRGVSIADIIFEAGATQSAELMEVGQSQVPGEVPAPGPIQATTDAAAADPTSLHDVFFRIGGTRQGKATVSLVVNSHHVILDHIWAWRADHGQGVGWTQNTADTGIIINGRDVTAYALFVEHYQKDEVIWNGDHGTVIFFQNEMPYDPPSQAAWNAAPGIEGFAAFKINDSVTRFRGYAMGSYSFFNQGMQIFAANAFQVPATLASASLQNLFTIFLNPTASGGIRHVINGQGGPSTAANPDIPVAVQSYP